MSDWDKKEIKKYLAHELKGAGLAIVFVMKDEGPLGEEELAQLTNYNRKTVRKAMAKLKSMNLAQNNRRYNGWMLTAQGYQLGLLGEGEKLPLELEGENLPLELEGENLPLEGEKLPLELEGENLPLLEGEKLPLEGEKLPLEGEKLPLVLRSSSSSSSINGLNKNINIKLLLRKNEGEKFPLEGEFFPLVNMLTGKGSPRRKAEEAIKAAISRKESKIHIETQIKNWFTYCMSDNGVGIRTPPVFVTKKILNGEYAPEVELSSHDEIIGQVEIGGIFYNQKRDGTLC